MNRATPAMRALAGLLIAGEAGEAKSTRMKGANAFPVTQKLRPHLATLMGSGGYQALLLRALALASAEIPWLKAVRVAADGSLEGLDELEAQLGAEEILEGRMVVVAQLLGLLVAFIGESLMLRLVGEIWPRLSLTQLKASKDDKK